MPIIVQMSLPTSWRNLGGVADADEEDAMDCAFVVVLELAFYFILNKHCSQNYYYGCLFLVEVPIHL